MTLIDDLKKLKESIIEEKIEKSKFRVQCQSCGEWIRGTSEKHLLSGLRSHLLLRCKGKKDEGDLAAVVQ